MTDRKGYTFRRIAQHQAWFERHRETLPVPAQIVMAELLVMNVQQREAIKELLVKLSEVTGKDNPDGLHDSVQDGTRLELRSDRHYRRRRLEWENP